MTNDRQNLEQELKEAQERLRRLREELQQEKVEFDTEDIDPNIYEREKNLALIQNLEAKAASIERALAAMDKGRYGLCERCGQPIGEERLAVLPETTLCVKCQAEIEKLKKRGLA